MQCRFYWRHKKTFLFLLTLVLVSPCLWMGDLYSNRDWKCSVWSCFMRSDSFLNLFNIHCHECWWSAIEICNHGLHLILVDRWLCPTANLSFDYNRLQFCRLETVKFLPFHFSYDTKNLFCSLLPSKQTNKQKENLHWPVYVSEWRILMVIEIGSTLFGLVLWDLIISLICSTSIAMNIDGAQLKFSIMDST